MAALVSNPLPGLEAWKAEVLRLTAFHQLGPQTTDHNWWEAVTRGTPETKNLKPREGGYEVAGAIGSGILTLKADFSRFDWLFTANPSLDKPLGEFPTAGPLPEALGRFVECAQSWLSLAPALTRIAFGAVLLQPVRDREAGYIALGDYLPSVKLDPEGTSEFTYSINRHFKAEQLDGLHVNRLSKWAVVHLQPMLLKVVAGGRDSVTEQVLGSREEYIRLEVDINTEATRREPLPGAQMARIFELLVDLGCRIAERGDIK